MTESTQTPNPPTPIDRLQTIVSVLNSCVNGLEGGLESVTEAQDSPFDELSDIVHQVEQQVELIREQQFSFIDQLTGNLNDSPVSIPISDVPTATDPTDVRPSRDSGITQTPDSASNTPTRPTTNHRGSLSLANTIFEFSDDAIVVLRDWVCIFSNRAADELFQWTEDTINGDNILDVIDRHFEVNDQWQQSTRRELLDKGVIIQEIKRRQGGENLWYELNLRQSKIHGEDRVLVTARNISQRKQYELELAQSHDFLHNTINSVLEPLSVKSSDLDILLVNDSFCKTHNVRREDILGKPAQIALPGAYSREIAECERQVLATGKGQATIESFVDGNDEPFILSTHRSTFRDKGSGAAYVVAISRDVTTEIKRENRLRLMASVFEHAQEGAAILNPDGEICEANPEFIGTIEQSHAKTLGQNLSTFVNCDPHQFSEILEMACSGRPWFGYVKIVNKRKDEVSCWLSLSPAKNRRGKTTNLIAMFSDISQIEDTRKELQRQALHDSLTDLPNRRYFRKKIVELIESDTDGEARFGVSFLDLDDFKIVNDTLGHDAGDRLLVEVSRRVKDRLGSDCFFARFGGDEFALLVMEEHDEPFRTHQNSQAIIDTLSKPFDLGGHQVHIGVSVGTTVYPDDATDVESLMRHADVAMYKAKDEGKNKVAVFSAELVEVVENRQAMLTELRLALDHGEIKVAYQPKLCLKNNRITSCEALARWTMNDGTVVPPAEFIPLAEDFGLISRLGDHVLKTVCHQAREWFEAGILSGPIAVNLSPRQLKEPNFFDRLVNTIEEAKVRPEWIEFEITENAVMEDMTRALNLMHKINKLGISIAMDDFGTGYSSLSYIREFPIRTLKIDTTFVKDLPHCSRAVAIARTVLSLGHGLNLQVVAEGVETREQLDFLRESGCDVVQGYLISRPISGPAYSEWIQSLN